MFSSVTMLVTFVVLGLPAGVAGIPWALLTGDIGPLGLAPRWEISFILTSYDCSLPLPIWRSIWLASKAIEAA